MGAVPRAEHERVRSGLQAEVTALSQKLSELGRKHEKTCAEVFQITELSKEVFKLKEALNGLSELPTKAGALPKAQQGQLEAGVLQGRIKALEEHGAEPGQTSPVAPGLGEAGVTPISLQGHMDEDVQRLLGQILKMQRLQEQGR
uniref:Uncharacterized protein n=1 Tax=Crocodylus porosus TaxID=8502 RepID=A0A7M4EQ87_CROPO